MDFEQDLLHLCSAREGHSEAADDASTADGSSMHSMQSGDPTDPVQVPCDIPSQSSVSWPKQALAKVFTTRMGDSGDVSSRNIDMKTRPEYEADDRDSRDAERTPLDVNAKLFIPCGRPDGNLRATKSFNMMGNLPFKDRLKMIMSLVRSSLVADGIAHMNSVQECGAIWAYVNHSGDLGRNAIQKQTQGIILQLVDCMSSTFILARGTRPFSTTQDGFHMTVCDVPCRANACRNMLTFGHCEGSGVKGCGFEHPRQQATVNVVFCPVGLSLKQRANCVQAGWQ